MGRTSCQSQQWLWAQCTPYSGRANRSQSSESQWGEGQGKKKSFNRNSLKKNKLTKPKLKHPCFLSTITAPPPQFYFNVMFHILFCFQVTFQEKGHFFFSTISHNSLIKHSIYHKPLPTRSQVCSYWLWFIDEWNSQLCRRGLDRHNLVPWVKIQSQRAPSRFISLGSWLKINTVRDYQHSFQHDCWESWMSEPAGSTVDSAEESAWNASHTLSNSLNLRDCAELRSHVLIMSGKWSISDYLRKMVRSHTSYCISPSGTELWVLLGLAHDSLWT